MFFSFHFTLYHIKCVFQCVSKNIERQLFLIDGRNEKYLVWFHTCGYDGILEYM